MKKVFIITLVDGRVFKFPAIQVLPDMPLNAKANDLPVLKAACELSWQGFCPDSTKKKPEWIAGSRISTVVPDFEFVEPLTIEK